MFGQFPDWFWLWLEFAVVLEPEEEEGDELPEAALAIAAPPPATAPTAASVTRAMRNRLIFVHLLPSFFADRSSEPARSKNCLTLG
jgi:hypothetical protein